MKVESNFEFHVFVYSSKVCCCDAYDQARSQDLEKGGYFERVRSVQTTLTRIFIDLESVSDGLSEI